MCYCTMRLTFKEYIESKQTLIEVISRSPIQVLSYSVSKYCKLPVLEDGEKIQKLLKPKQVIMVEWEFQTLSNPTPMRLIIEDENDEISESTYQTNWTGTKLKEWLRKNSTVKNDSPTIN